MSTVVMQITLVLETCCKCGIQFAMPQDYDERRRRDHQDFYCPSGHPQRYTGKSDVEVERDKALAAQAQINEERHLRLVAESERDKALRSKKKMERRIASGVCICCNRTFDNLAKHMKSKHKEIALPDAERKRIEGTVQ